MRLAVIDPEDCVLLAWPTVADAHHDLADMLATRIADELPAQEGFRRKNKPVGAPEIAAVIRAHLYELQRETVRL